MTAREKSQREAAYVAANVRTAEHDAVRAQAYAINRLMRSKHNEEWKRYVREKLAQEQEKLAAKEDNQGAATSAAAESSVDKVTNVQDIAGGLDDRACGRRSGGSRRSGKSRAKSRRLIVVRPLSEVELLAANERAIG